MRPKKKNLRLKMKLIREEIETAKVLVEEKDGKKTMFIEGIFLQGNLKNRNGRFYPVETLEREVNRYCEEFVGKGRALGELGHPEAVSYSHLTLPTKA